MVGARDWRNWALLAALGVIWGGSFTVTGVAVRDLPPLTIAAARLILGAAALLLLARAVAGRFPGFETPRDRRLWLAAIAAGFAANAMPFTLLAWAQSHVPSSLTAIFMAALPLIALPLAHAFVPGERLTPARIAGFLIGFLGVIHLIGVDALSALGGSDLQILAQFACLMVAAGYATGSVVTKLAPPVHPVTFGAMTLSFGAAMTVPAALLFEAPLSAPALAAWTPSAQIAILALGLIPTALAMVLLQILLKRTGPSFLSLVNYQVPLWAVVFGVTLLGESMPERAPAALVVILVGVAVSQGAHRAAFGALSRAARGGAT